MLLVTFSIAVSLFICYRNGHALTHSLKKPFECPMPSCGRSYCDARSLRRHIDNYHARPLGAAAAMTAGVSAASVDTGMTGTELSSTREHLNSLSSSVSDDDESRQLAHLAAYELVSVNQSISQSVRNFLKCPSNINHFWMHCQ